MSAGVLVRCGKQFGRHGLSGHEMAQNMWARQFCVRRIECVFMFSCIHNSVQDALRLCCSFALEAAKDQQPCAESVNSKPRRHYFGQVYIQLHTPVCSFGIICTSGSVQNVCISSWSKDFWGKEVPEIKLGCKGLLPAKSTTSYCSLGSLGEQSLLLAISWKTSVLHFYHLYIFPWACEAWTQIYSISTMWSWARCTVVWL